jgi:hypothetical protein
LSTESAISIDDTAFDVPNRERVAGFEQHVRNRETWAARHDQFSLTFDDDVLAKRTAYRLCS